jgi:chromosome segregation ATPase
LIKLEAAGKKNSQQYKDLKKRYNEVWSEIKKNTEQIAKLTNGINVNNLTMNPLKKQAKQLQKQLDDTSKALVFNGDYVRWDKTKTNYLCELLSQR